MKGIEIARSFFDEWGRPYLERNEPALRDRVAAGVFGGSEIHGADDALSQDHNWGPTFVLLLADDDFAAHGQRVRDEINRAAPREWRGRRYQQHHPDKPPIRVASIDGYLRRRLGFSRPPADIADWLGGDPIALEVQLYDLRHGVTFHDPLGEWSARRRLFHEYPHEVRLSRICDELHKAWNHGPYNYCLRLRARNDAVAQRLALAGFSEAVMRLILLLENDYSPYWKWLAFATRQHELAPLLAQFGQDSAEIIKEISRRIGAILVEQGLAAPIEAGREHWLLGHLQAGPLASVRKRASLELFLGPG